MVKIDLTDEKIRLASQTARKREISQFFVLDFFRISIDPFSIFAFTPFCNIKNIFQQIKNRRYIVGIISNQSIIALGTGVGYNFKTEFASYGCDVYEICPHDTLDNCDCRKPKSGMLLSVCKRLNLQPENCVLIGDRYSDIVCAKNVGGNAMLVLTGKGKVDKERTLKTYPTTPILDSFDCILDCF